MGVGIALIGRSYAFSIQQMKWTAHLPGIWGRPYRSKLAAYRVLFQHIIVFFTFITRTCFILKLSFNEKPFSRRIIYFNSCACFQPGAQCFLCWLPKGITPSGWCAEAKRRYPAKTICSKKTGLAGKIYLHTIVHQIKNELQRYLFHTGWYKYFLHQIHEA